MKADDINTIQDMQHYCEGTVNDFDSGLATKEETINALKEYTLRVIWLFVNGKIKVKNKKNELLPHVSDTVCVYCKERPALEPLWICRECMIAYNTPHILKQKACRCFEKLPKKDTDKCDVCGRPYNDIKLA